MPNDIWAGVNFGNSIINPGSVAQTYNPNTGQTTYGTNTAINAIAQSSAQNASQGIYAPAVVTPTNTPAGAPVYQGAKQGYAGMGPQTAFTERTVNGTPVVASDYSLNPNLTVKVQDVVPESVISTAGNVATLKNQTNETRKNIAQTNLNKFNSLYAPQIQTNGYLKTRDTAAEQKAIGNFGKVFGTLPKTSGDWALINKALYGQETPPILSKESGVVDSEKAASEDIATPEGKIDPIKLIDQLQKNLNEINKLIADEREAFDNSINEIGNQVGETMPLIQGEEAYQERRKEIRLNRLLDEKKALLESGDLQLKLYEYQRQLRQDQQQAMGSIIGKFLEAGVPINASLAKQYSDLTGINAQALEDGFALAAKNWKEQNASKNIEWGVVGQHYDENSGQMVNDYGWIDKSNKTVSYANGGAPGVPGTPTTPVNQSDTVDFNTWANNLGSITQKFSTPVSYFADGRKTHQAIDIGGKANSPITSPVSGRVIEVTKDSGNKKGWGNSVVIQDNAGNKWRLAHFNALSVRNGDMVSAGSQVLGYLGNTGFVLGEYGGYHTHVEVVDKSGKRVDPTLFTTSSGTSTTPNTTYSNSVNSAVSMINSGQLTIDKVLTSTAYTKKEKTDIVNALVASGTQPKSVTDTQERAKSQVAAIDDLINHPGFDSAVGPSWTGFFTRNAVAGFETGQQADFIAGVTQLIDQKTLDTLLNLKKAGGTLGALSEGEKDMLRSAASKIGTWEYKKDGKIKGYKVSEKYFKKELENIKKLAEKAYSEAGYFNNTEQNYPSGTVVESGGIQYISNGDGTFTPIN